MRLLFKEYKMFAQLIIRISNLQYEDYAKKNKDTLMKATTSVLEIFWSSCKSLIKTVGAKQLLSFWIGKNQ